MCQNFVSLLCELTHQLPVTALWAWYYYCPHFTHENETEIRQLLEGHAASNWQWQNWYWFEQKLCDSGAMLLTTV